MLVLAATNGSLNARLEFAARDRFRFVPARSWDEALSAILTKPLEVGVLDPALEGPARSQEIERLRVLFPSFPLILYTQLSPAVAPVLLRLGQIGIKQVVIARHDDYPARLNELLSNEAAHAVAGQVVDALSDLLAGCPTPLKWSIESAVREPAT